MLGNLRSLGQAVSARGRTVFAGIRDIIADYRARKLHAAFDRKLRDEIAATKCWNCLSPVGERPFRDHDFPGRYYCSLDCRNMALIKRDRELDEKMARPPAALTQDEQALLVGKASPGMYYEAGRCVQCGHVLDDPRAIFAFCSATCDERATRPYMTFTERLVDSDEYKKAVKDREDFTRKDPDIIEEVKRRCESSVMTDDEIRDYLDQQIKLAELLHDRRKSFARGEARVSFLRKWELQRGYVLEQGRLRATKPPEGRL
jgi:hypothetical protein